MFSNFYLVILLICIGWTHSVRQKDGVERIHKFGRYAKKTIINDRNKMRRIHQTYFDKSHVNVDEARFSQPDDELDEAAGIRHCDQKRRRSSDDSDYKSFAGVSKKDNIRRKAYNLEYMNLVPNNLDVRREDLKAKFMSDNSNLDQANTKYQNQANEQNKNVNHEQNKSPPHNPSKKCAFPKIQIPLFFRKKQRVTTKPPKKRKLFSFGSKKTHTIEANKSNEDPFMPYKVKRSYMKSDPALKKKLITGRERFKKNPPIIHNSRQYFQHPLQYKEQTRNFKDYVRVEDNRWKRDEPTETKIRQLKELEEVQKKIDNIQIAMPELIKVPGKN